MAEEVVANGTIHSKFFAQANGDKTKPAPRQQTKLSFSTKAAVEAKNGKNEEDAAPVKKDEEEVKEEVEEEVEEKGMFVWFGLGRGWKGWLTRLG